MPIKIVTVNSELGPDTKIECRAGKHTFIIDQASNAGGRDLGPSPLEYYLASLAGCICAIGRIVAKQKNIALRGMSITTNGELNTDVLLGKNNAERAGFTNIELQARIDADLSEAQKLEFLHEVERRCPVSENTTNPSCIVIKLAI